MLTLSNKTGEIETPLNAMAFRFYNVFVQQAWSHVVPGSRPLSWNWYSQALCEHLQALLEKRLTGGLLVEMPPNTGKSTILSQCFPAWAWLHDPSLRFLYYSNSDSNAQRDALACRRLIASNWYRNTFAPQWRIQADKDSAQWYETSAGGHRLSLPILSKGTTGKKGDWIVVDDANDAQSVLSAATRQAVNDTYHNAIWDRGTDLSTVVRIVAGQRTAERDLIGECKIKYGYPSLLVREEYDAVKCRPAPLGRYDPRKIHGQLLRPKQVDAKFAAEYKRRNRSGWDTKHNQEPRQLDGNQFKAKDLRYWRRDGDWYVLPGIDRAERRYVRDQFLVVFGVADGAASAKTSADFTCISTFALLPNYDLLWLGCRREQLEIPDQPKVAIEEYNRHKMEFLLVETTASNCALYQHLLRTKITVRQITPRSKDKLTRATPAIIFVESHRLWLPELGHVEPHEFPVEDVVESLLSFTGDDSKDAHDDVEDTLAYAVIWKDGYAPESEAVPDVPSSVGGVANFSNSESVLDSFRDLNRSTPTPSAAEKQFKRM